MSWHPLFFGATNARSYDGKPFAHGWKNSPWHTHSRINDADPGRRASDANVNLPVTSARWLEHDGLQQAFVGSSNIVDRSKSLETYGMTLKSSIGTVFARRVASAILVSCVGHASSSFAEDTGQTASPAQPVAQAASPQPSSKIPFLRC
jgi:hypothetical protein